MALAINHATSKKVPILCYSYEYGELSEDFVENDDLCEEVRRVRNKLHLQNKERFVNKERIGNNEDNLICTLLDPRFKLINFNGSTVEITKEAELYLKENYKADWSPKTRVEIQAPSSTTTPGSTSTPSSLSLAPTNGKKKKIVALPFYMLFIMKTKQLLARVSFHN
jgi:hypothetical protein